MRRLLALAAVALVAAACGGLSPPKTTATEASTESATTTTYQAKAIAKFSFVQSYTGRATKWAHHDDKASVGGECEPRQDQQLAPPGKVTARNRQGTVIGAGTMGSLDGKISDVRDVGQYQVFTCTYTPVLTVYEQPVDLVSVTWEWPDLGLSYSTDVSAADFLASKANLVKSDT